jgi:hypothetical protein
LAERKDMKMMSTVSCILKLIFVLLHFHLLFSNYSGAVADANHVGCIEKERHALLQLKASMVLYDTSRLPTWDSKSYDCCEWEGIFCRNQTAHVEMLDLNAHQFGPFLGEINASLIELQHLKYLNLSGVYFSNSIFQEFFGSLSNLRYLDLQSSFNGGRIPNEMNLRVQSLTNLETSLICSTLILVTTVWLEQFLINLEAFQIYRSFVLEPIKDSNFMTRIMMLEVSGFLISRF